MTVADYLWTLAFSLIMVSGILLVASNNAGLLPHHGLVSYWLPANMLTSYWLFDV